MEEPSAVGQRSSPDGFTPLDLAAFFGHAETVDVLLRHDAPVETYAEAQLRAGHAARLGCGGGMTDVAGPSSTPVPT